MGSLATAVRRSSRLLTFAQAFLWAALGIFVANGPLAIVRMSGRTSWAGLMIAVLAVAQAVGAVGSGRLMDRAGRRPGLALGYVLIAAAGVVMVLSEVGDSAAGMLVGTGLLGAGAGAALLGRGAVAEMHPARARGRAVGRLLVAGTIGAVGVPPLVGVLQGGLEGSETLDPLLLPWLIVPVAAAAGLACVLAVRPDPRDLAVDEVDLSGARRPLREILGQRPVRAALVVVAAAQAVMVSIMGVATIVIHDHGGGAVASSLLVSRQLGGMFAYTPLSGGVIDRWGRRPALAAGTVVSAAGALAGAFASGVAPFGAGFFLIGLGWSAAYVGATAVLSDLTAATERAGTLGFADLLTHSVSAVGGITGGIVADVAGFSTLGVVMAAVGGAALLAVIPLREPRPGRWEAEPDAAVAAVPPAGAGATDGVR